MTFYKYYGLENNQNKKVNRKKLIWTRPFTESTLSHRCCYFSLSLLIDWSRSGRHTVFVPGSTPSRSPGARTQSTLSHNQRNLAGNLGTPASFLFVNPSACCVWKRISDDSPQQERVWTVKLGNIPYRPLSSLLLVCNCFTAVCIQYDTLSFIFKYSRLKIAQYSFCVSRFVCAAMKVRLCVSKCRYVPLFMYKAFKMSAS